MIPKSIIARTIDRYQRHAAERARTEAKLASGSPLTADTPSRVEKRLAHLARTSAITRPATGGGVEVATPSVTLERIIGTSDLMSVTFLEGAVAAARTVARVRIRTGTRTVGYGTGSLVAPRLLLTNNHVLGSAAEAASSLAEFNYQDGVATPTVLMLDPGALFLTDPELDYTLVALREDAALSGFGFNRLIEQEGKVLVGECLNIIQHPNGELKQVALRENQLKDILPQFLHYHTDTAPGSSGSPVFNDQWEIVALHHSGVPSTDAQGRYLTKDGTLWDPSMGEQRIHWIANEGARVSRIVAHVKGQSLQGAARTLRDSIFTAEAAPLTPFAPRDTRAAVATGGDVGPDGTATWTVPIRISISLGGHAAAAAAPASPPAPVGPPPAADTPPLPADLQAALDEARAARSRPYYDRVADEAARDRYYEDLDMTGNGQERFAALAALLASTHAPRPSYKPSTHVYPFVDLHPDGKLRSIYSQQTFDPEELIREDFLIEAERARRLQEILQRESSLTAEAIAAEAAALEAALPFNCEHVVPQSWFTKREPMRGDLHHLFACESGCNSFRGNIPYFDFPDFEEAVRTECGKRDGTRFEPSAAKGIVARATLYFLLRYPGQVNDVIASYDAARLATLLSWHASHPVTDYERHRNMAIFEKQGNRNPLIDHPSWASRVDFEQGL